MSFSNHFWMSLLAVFVMQGCSSQAALWLGACAAEADGGRVYVSEPAGETVEDPR